MIPLLLLGAFLFSHCKNENTATKSTSLPTSPGTSVKTPTSNTAKPEIYLYATIYNNMQLRESDNLQAKVVEKLSLGEFLEGTGEKSATPVEVQLGGMNYLEPFIKSTHLTPEEKSGWIYGGGVTTIYAGPRSDAPDIGKLSLFSILLRDLDVKKMDSGKKAWDFVRSNFATTKGPTADAAYILLERFLSRMEFEGQLYKLTEKVAILNDDWQKINDGTYDFDKNKVFKSLGEAGFRIVSGEGMLFPIPDSRQFNAFFGPKATPAMAQYLNQDMVEQNKTENSDGGIIIPLEEVADRGIFWENFNTANPNFVLHPITLEHEKWRRLSLVNGADNTPVFNSETKAVSDDFKKVWAYILQKYPSSKIAKDVQEISALVAAAGGKCDAKVEKWREDKINNY